PRYGGCAHAGGIVMTAGGCISTDPGQALSKKPYVPGRRSPAAGYGAAAILQQLSPPGAVRMLPCRHPARHDRVALAPGEPGRMSTDRPRLSAAPGCGRSAWPDTAPDLRPDDRADH